MSIKLVDLTEVDGDIFNAKEEAVVVTINTVGAMGKGIAKSCKLLYPDLYLRYKKYCLNKKITETVLTRCVEDRDIILFPTKRHYSEPSRLSDIQYLIPRLNLACIKWGIKTIAIPPLGMGNGGITGKHGVSIVNLVHDTFKDSTVDAVMYLPKEILDLIGE